MPRTINTGNIYGAALKAIFTPPDATLPVVEEASSLSLSAQGVAVIDSVSNSIGAYTFDAKGNGSNAASGFTTTTVQAGLNYPCVIFCEHIIGASPSNSGDPIFGVYFGDSMVAMIRWISSGSPKYEGLIRQRNSGADDRIDIIQTPVFSSFSGVNKLALVLLSDTERYLYLQSAANSIAGTFYTGNNPSQSINPFPASPPFKKYGIGCNFDGAGAILSGATPGKYGDCGFFNTNFSASQMTAYFANPSQVFASAAPVLSSPTATATGNTTGIGTVSTTGSDGVIWRKAAATAQTDPGGGLEAGAGWTSQAVTASGTQSFSSLGTLTTNTAYVVSYFHVSAAGARGSVVTSAPFTPPTMTSSGTLPAQSGTASSAFTYVGATPESQITIQGVGSSAWNLTNAGGSGLSAINAATGVPSGTLTATPGTYTVTVTKIDSSTAGTNPTDGGAPPQTIVRTFSLTVNSASATAVTVTGPSSGTVGSASTAFTVGANGVIGGTVTVTPSDAGNGGTFTPTSVNISAGAPTATFTYTAASAGAKTISVTNNGGLSNPSPLTYTAGGVATAITLTGPTVGLAGVASSPFTVGANGAIVGTITVTPSAAGCTFTPASVNISAGAPTATFTCTPASVGTKSITLSNNGALSNPSAYNYLANSALATTLSITLTTDGVTPAANLTGLKVAVYDQPTPDLWATKTPIYTTGNGVTNASGVFTCSIAGLTALTPGGIAGIAISSSDGTLTQGSAQKGYVGPVAVS